MVALWEYFADLFSYVLLCDERLRVGEHPAYEEVRTTCKTLFHQQRERAVEQHREDGFWQAGFAVVAWIDETLQKARTGDHHPWNHAEHWGHFPLQHELFNIADAGEEFFPRLQSLPPEQDEVREVYYLCLALGYAGPADEETRRSIRQTLAGQLPGEVEDLRQTAYVTPQPYDPSHYLPVQRRKKWLVLCLGLSGLALLATVLVLLPFLFPQPPAGAQIVEILRQEELLDCAHVTAETQPRQRVVMLTGRVQDHAQRQAIRKRVQTIRGVTAVTEAFAMIPHPFCDALGLVERFLDHNSGLSIDPIPWSVVGDRLVIQGTTPSFASYLYVLNFNPQHGVWQMFPNGWEAVPTAPFKPQTPYTIGKGRVLWRVTRPVGRELVMVIASKEPLVLLPPTLQPHTAEPVTSFLRRLEAALTGKTKGDVAVAYIFTDSWEQE